MAKKIRTLVVGPFEVNCYLFWDEQTADAVIIDPGDRADAIIGEIEKNKLTPKAILLTHGHADHIAAVADVKKHFNIPLYVGAGEEELLRSPSANVSAFFDQPIVAPDADHTLEDEQALIFGSLRIRVLATPGHSPGGVCYFDEEQGVLFCGDTLFAYSIGRTDLPGGSHQVLLESIDRKIMALPDTVVCLPGHGPQTTVGTERTDNPFLIGGRYA